MTPSSAYRRTLFDTPNLWLNEPQNCYRIWLNQQRLKNSTKIVYEAMFGRFCDWLVQTGKSLDRCESGDIAAFLNSENPNLPASRREPQQSRQRRQYLRQLERVYAHLNEIGLAVGNPAKQASIDGHGDGRDQSTRFLNIEERNRAIEAITAQLECVRHDPANWIDIRDLALISVLLGAGLKVGNLEHLTLNCINEAEGRIELSQAHYTHRARIFPFALPVLRVWLRVRADLADTLQLPDNAPVFLANRSKGFGRHADSLHMHASGVFRRVQKFLESIQIEGERCCPQTLRNTYAAMLIEAGASDSELIDFLGLQASITARRLRTLLSVTDIQDSMVAETRSGGFGLAY